MRSAIRAAVAVAALSPAAAQAQWREARTAHFVVYSEGAEAQLVETATRLERLDRLMRMLSGDTVPDADRRANPLSVYVVDDLAAVRRLYGRGSEAVGGFYNPRVTGSVAFTPRTTGDPNFNPQVVLFHEYAHHYLLGSYAAAYPAWFSEGYSEYMSTVRFGGDVVEFGVPAQHRAETLLYGGAMSVRDLFAFGDRKLRGEQVASLYALGWLMTHFILAEPERVGQFNRYLALLAEGKPSVTAAETAFGDLRTLSRTVTAYLRRNKFAVRRLPADALEAGRVEVRALSEGQDRMMPLRMRSTRGVDAKSAGDIARDARAIAARYPRDAMVQGWYAEMAYDAGDDTAADSAADAALAADPSSMQALLYKARVGLRRAATAKAAPDAQDWVDARSWILKANRIDSNDPAALALFYESYVMAQTPPRASAVAGLHRALQLAPQDPSLRLTSAVQYLRDDEPAMARMVLRPLAYDPHASADNAAARLIAMIDAGGKGPEIIAAMGTSGDEAR